MILKTIRFWIGTIQWKLGEGIYKLGVYLSKKGGITLVRGINKREKVRFEIRLKKGNVFAPFKEATNQGKEIITIVEEGKLGSIYKN